jgi:hypothetical protein
MMCFLLFYQFLSFELVGVMKDTQREIAAKQTGGGEFVFVVLII